MEWCFGLHFGDGAVVRANVTSVNQISLNAAMCWMWDIFHVCAVDIGKNIYNIIHPLTISTQPCVVFVFHVTQKRSNDVAIWCAEMLSLIMHRSKLNIEHSHLLLISAATMLYLLLTLNRHLRGGKVCNSSQGDKGTLRFSSYFPA